MKQTARDPDTRLRGSSACPSSAADWSALALATAQELQPDQVFVLRDVAATVLPSAIGRAGPGRGGRQFPQVDPRLQGRRRAVARLWRAAPRQVRSFTEARRTSIIWPRCNRRRRHAAGDSARCRSSVRRELLDAAFKAADVRNLPGRPDGKHVVADLMAHYFRSSAANDLCYNARIGRNTYRAIRVTTVRPQPLLGET